MDDAPLCFENLAHSYGGPPIFEGVNLRVAAGELVAILGASGSGKSTLLRAAAGFVTPTCGTVTLGGKIVAQGGVERVPAEKRGVGMMFQDYALFPHMSVAENIAFGLHATEESPDRAAQVLEMVGLAGLESRRPGELSGGQQQRVALARALAPRPSLLLLDEPFANLDGPLRHEVSGQIVEILAKEGVGALLVTHDREEALGLAQRVAILAPEQEGPATLLQVGSPQEVYRNPSSRASAELTGPVSYLQGPEGTSQAIRPEQAAFHPKEKGEAILQSIRYTGAGWELKVSTPEGPILLDHRGQEAPRIGTRGWVEILERPP
jgi:iron(III) transport system ATP-binding protein